MNLNIEEENNHDRQHQCLFKQLDSESFVKTANILYETCPNIINEIKQKIFQEVEVKAKELCKRKNGSVLHHKTYEDLESFNIDTIVDELSENFPFLCKLLVQLSSKVEMVDSIKPKLCLIYSMLMSSRWHELSFFKRVTTILLIEGGCSKKVCIEPKFAY